MATHDKVHSFKARATSWWKRKPQDFKAEIVAHLQLEADELRAEGLPPADAEFAARRAFGNPTSAEERFYESSRWMFLHHMVRDVRFAARMLSKDATFAVLAILGLTLGIGLSTAIFALINASIRWSDRAELQDPASYVGLNRRGRDGDFSYPDYRYYRDRSTAFVAISAESARSPFVLGPVSTGEEAQDVEGRFVSADFLAVIGLQPFLGRSFSKEDERVGAPPVALLNFGYWRRRFAGDPEILGKTVTLNSHAVTVIGVAHAGFARADAAAFYLPLELQPVLLDREDRLRDSKATWLHLEARLRPGVTVSQAQAEIDVLSHALHQSRLAGAGALDPTERGVFISAGGANPRKRKQLALMALAVILTVSMILLIACSNLASLLLARAAVRSREIGVRLSLGASRARVVCQLLTESMMLAIVGGAFGLLFSHWLAKALFLLMNPPQGLELPSDPRVVVYSIALSLATEFSFGLAPALAATKTNPAQALHAEGLSGTSRSPSQRIWSFRNLLVIVPLAVSLMLLIGAGFTVRLVQQAYLKGPSFDTTRLIGMSLRLNAQGYDEARTLQFQEDLRRRIGAMTGVSSVALASAMPLSNQMGWSPLVIEGSVQSPELHADYNIVSTGFFETIGSPVVRGRAFTASDRDGSPPVAMVNQALAQRYWPNDEPIGKRLRLATGASFFEIVGIAPDLEDANGPFSSVRPTVYVPYGQGKLFLNGLRTGTPPYQVQFLVRASGEASSVKFALRQLVLASDSSLRVNVQTIQEMLESRTGPMKTISFLLSMLGALALIMASVGIYAILAYAFSQRTREIGIRVALGARRGEILALVMRRTLALIAAGIGLGLIGALALNRVFASSLANLGGLDAVTCVSVTFLLGAVAILASYLPARKALRVDPMQALRCE